MANHRLVSVLSILLSIIAAVTFAEQAQFYDQSTNYGVALSSTLVSNGSQVRLQLTAPISYGWAALGSGSMMTGSAMLIIYPNAKGDAVTLSVRTTQDHNTPTVSGTTHINARLSDSSIKNGKMVANIIWQDTSAVLSGVVNLRNHRQPFIWAVGPNEAISSNNMDVTIKEHSKYGVIFVDMPQSQFKQAANVKPSVSGTNNVNVRPQPAYYHTLILVHALLMAAAFVVVFPFGVIGLRLDIRHYGFKIHWILQLFATIAALGGFGLAVAMSILGIKYSAFSHPHQLVGIVITALLLAQVYLGRAHHVRFKLFKKRTAFSWLHMGLGQILIVAGMANTVFGLLFCGRRMQAVGVAGLAGLILLIMEVCAIRGHLKRRKDNARGERAEGYTSNYHKLKDVTISETEVGASRQNQHPMHDYRQGGYGNGGYGHQP